MSIDSSEVRLSEVAPTDAGLADAKSPEANIPEAAALETSSPEVAPAEVAAAEFAVSEVHPCDFTPHEVIASEVTVSYVVSSDTLAPAPIASEETPSTAKPAKTKTKKSKAPKTEVANPEAAKAEAPQARPEGKPADVVAEVTFRDLNLIEPLIAALDRAGYEHPTPIQASTIPLLLEGRDVLGQAQTGTGKTAAFALPILQRIDLANRRPQVLVLTPTRELAIQVAKSFEGYSREMGSLRVAPVYGGQDYMVQFRMLDRGAHVIVGTPGRVMDHMRRGSINLDALQCLVLDEADEMLRMGFADDVEWVLSQSPATRQIALFSATLPPPIRRIAQKYLNNPAEITIRQKTATADTVRQRYLIAAPHQKQAALSRVLEAEAVDGVIVFVKTRSTTEPLAEYLSNQGHRTAALNGDVAQKQRERIVDSFRSGKLDVLVATDVAARGLDVQRVSHVINYDLPFDSEAYVHRIGRTGRAGRSGEAILFVHPRERGLLKRLEQATRQTIEPMDIPSNRLINKQRVARFHERVTAALAHPDLEKFESILIQYQRANPETPTDKIAAAMAVLAHGDAPVLVTEELKQPSFVETRPARDDRRSTGPRSSGPRSADRDRPRAGGPRARNVDLEAYRIEVGHAHQVKPGNIVGAIASEAGLDSSMIGRIEIFDDHSVVGLPTGMPRDIFQLLQKVWVVGRQLNICRLEDYRGNSDRPRGDQGGESAPPRPKKPKRKKEFAKG
jgi:ATP-dependent RNA helicase DeaD